MCDLEELEEDVVPLDRRVRHRVITSRHRLTRGHTGEAAAEPDEELFELGQARIVISDRTHREEPELHCAAVVQRLAQLEVEQGAAHVEDDR